MSQSDPWMFGEVWPIRELRNVSIAPSRNHAIGRDQVILGMGGILAACALALVPLPIRVPGHAILKAVLPIAVGVSLAPRPCAGCISGTCAAAASGLLLLAGVGHLQMGAFTALLAFGLALDLALRRGLNNSWLLTCRLALAGLAANSLAFAMRWSLAWMQLDIGRPHSLTHFGVAAFLSFAICGVAAGILSALVFFAFPRRRRET